MTSRSERPPTTASVTTDIRYVFALTDDSPEGSSPFQGISMDLFNLAAALRGLVFLPSEVLEYGLPPQAALVRRMAGQGGWKWAPLALDAVLRLEIPAEDPFWVVFTSEETVAPVVAWAERQRYRPLVVGTTAGNGVTARAKLGAGEIRRHVSDTLAKVARLDPEVDRTLVSDCLNRWHPRPAEPNAFPDRGHNVVTPNVMALQSAGRILVDGGPFAGGMDRANYVSIIVESAEEVLRIRDGMPFADAFRNAPPGPDIVVTAPSFYLAYQTSATVKPAAPEPVRRLMRMFQRQDDYFVRSKGTVLADVLMSEDAKLLLRLRAYEQKIHTIAVGMWGASSLAATVRLPAAVNRGSGALRHLATHSRDGRRSEVKLRRLFSAVQDHYRKVVAPELLDLIGRSKTGIKLVTDAPLEWLPVGDLPLSLRFDVSRICSTPGNLMIGQLATPALLRLSFRAYQDVLLVSALEDGDPIADVLDRALLGTASLWKGKVRITRRKVRTVNELLAALDAFAGAVMIFDGHGFAGTAGEAGGLMIGGKPCDTWSLRGRSRMPPVVVLSACDTSAIDGSHASAANGFLACGARTVLGTLLPIDAHAAAVFLARLMHRLADYVPSAIEAFGRAVRWTEIISGMLRMQLLTDLLQPFVDDGTMSEEQMRKVNALGNHHINLLDPDWFDAAIDACAEEATLDAAVVRARFKQGIATSDAIRYVQLGSPESLILDDQKRLDGERPTRVIDRGATYTLQTGICGDEA